VNLLLRLISFARWEVGGEAVGFEKDSPAAGLGCTVGDVLSVCGLKSGGGAGFIRMVKLRECLDLSWGSGHEALRCGAERGCSSAVRAGDS